MNQTKEEIEKQAKSITLKLLRTLLSNLTKDINFNKVEINKFAKAQQANKKSRRSIVELIKQHEK